jgi:hypothetical protein
MSEPKIDKHVPMPSVSRHRYPFANMNVGDSFVVAYAKRDSVITAASQFVKQHQPAWQFTTRKVGDGEVRMWRVK